MLRILSIILASVAYWLAAFLVVFLACVVLPGDCGLERTPAGLDACLGTGRMVLIGGALISIGLYALGLRRPLSKR